MSEEMFSVVPAPNFDSDVDFIELSEYLCLKRLTESDRQKLRTKISKHNYNVFAFEELLSDSKFVIENKLHGDYNVGRFQPDVELLILLFRLFKSGNVFLTTSFDMNSADTAFLVGAAAQYPKWLADKNPYFLKKAEIEGFVGLWKKLENFEENKFYLGFPLGQYYETFERVGSRYNFVNFMTAFESLVFHGVDNIPRNIGTVIGIAIGMLLGTNEKERTQIRKDLEIAYSIRNCIVHGHLQEKLLKSKIYKDLDVDDFFDKVKEYLRVTLKRMLEE